ncbi:hypothetical protein BDB01DRAFT_716655, partial [Pilobolus umbonatus]
IKWFETDVDYKSNCVSVDEAAFHIIMKRSSFRLLKGTRAFMKVPITRLYSFGNCKC